MSHLLLFSVLAMLTGAMFYRKIIALQRERLNAAFGACSRRTPAVNTLRRLFLALGYDDLEAAFRRHACDLPPHVQHLTHAPECCFGAASGASTCTGAPGLSFCNCPVMTWSPAFSPSVTTTMSP